MGNGQKLRLPEGLTWRREGFKYLGVFLRNEVAERLLFMDPAKLNTNRMAKCYQSMFIVLIFFMLKRAKDTHFLPCLLE